MMRSTARKYPKEVWSKFSIVVRDASKLRRTDRQRRQKSGVYEAFEHRRLRTRLSKLSEGLMIAAGAEIARRWPGLAWSLCMPYLKSQSAVKKRIGLSSLLGLDKRHADRVLKLICEDPTLLRCGAGRRGSRFGASATFPARRIFRRFAKHASAQSLAATEAAICSFVPTKEKTIWRFAHHYFMGTTRWNGALSKHMIYPRTIFAAQYALFDAFPRSRMTDQTRDWFGVLCRKFGPIKSILKEPPSSISGVVSSSIPENRALGLSDKGWLRVIMNSASVNSKRRWSRGVMTLMESTPQMFSAQLQRAAHRHPPRFAHLATKIPLSSNRDYIGAIIRALGETKPPANAPPEWAMAHSALIEMVLARFAPMCNDREIAVAVGWLFNNRAAESWSNDAIHGILEIARFHSDPDPAITSVFSSGGKLGESKPDFVLTAINCARGVAAVAISSLLWNNTTWLPVLQPAISHFEEDPHPSVRIAATRIAVPMLNINKTEAVRLFLSLNSHPNDEVLLGHELSEFLGYTLISHFDELRPILERMMASAIGEVAKRGAEWATLTYLHTGKMKKEVDSCLVGSVSLRTGVATILARELSAGRCDDISLGWSATLLDDADESVRRTIANTFWRAEFYMRPYAHQIFTNFIKSHAFGANIGHALHGLKSTTASLTGFADLIHATVDRLSEAALTAGPDVGLSSQYLPDVLLRLYEQSESDPASRRRCLDVLDKALEDRLGYDMTKAVDQ